MSDFFIHDQMVQAVRHMHPGMEHGRDFLVLMGINPDGTPASDAWIERWPAGLPIPTMEDMKAAYSAFLLIATSHSELSAATLAEARAMRLPIMQVLDGMQASALVNGTTVVDAGQTVPLAAAIEARKHALRLLPQAVDLSAATTQQQMEYIVLLAYKAIVDAAPAEIKTAFDSLKP